MENQTENKSNESIIEELLAIIDKPTSLFDKLWDIKREGLTKNDNLTSELIITLNQKYEIDVSLLAAKAIEDGANCFDVSLIMQDAIPTLTPNADSLISLLEKIYLGTQGDLTSFQQYRPIQELARKLPQFAKELVSILLSIQKPFVTGYISTILVTLSGSCLANSHSELLTLAGHESVYAVKSAINALGRLSYQLPEDQELINKSIFAIKSQLNRNSIDLELEIVAAMGNLLGKSEEARNILLAFAKKDNPQILYQVSYVLLLNCKAFFQDNWFKDCFILKKA